MSDRSRVGLRGASDPLAPLSFIVSLVVFILARPAVGFFMETLLENRRCPLSRLIHVRTTRVGNNWDSWCIYHRVPSVMRRIFQGASPEYNTNTLKECELRACVARLSDLWSQQGLVASAR